MVIMEKEVPTPSPSLVGQEFVKQYYTLLNKAPEYIHRFYGKLSSYVRGETYRNGEPETPAIGQEEIQRKIVSLGFKDCRTKIRQVDAHSTVGNSVVVQVTGEISNKELPLRRFMQTFVLAPQGDHPCKFYVHNDIFRYQDVVFMDGPYKQDHAEFVQAEEQLETADVIADHDRNNSTGAAGYAVENIEQEAASAATAGEQQQQENVQQPAEVAAAVTMTNGVDQHDEEVSQVLENNESSSAASASSPASTAAVAVEDVVSEEASPAVTEPSATTTTETSSSEPEPSVEEQVETAPAQAPVAATEPQPPTPVKAAAPVQEVEEVVQETPAFAKTFSWADVTKNTNKSSPAPAPVVHHQPVMVKAQPPAAPQPPSEPVEVTSASSNNQRSSRAPRPNRNAQNFNNNRDSEDRTDNTNFNRRPQQGGPNGGGLSTTRYPDNQQIFVGNLTNEINENDLRSHFGGYGNVIDVRINYSHTHNPNFGFVIFEDPKSVEQVLHELPNQMKSIRINIEEKKQRRGGDRRGNGGAGDYNRRGGGGNMNMRRNNNSNGGGVSMMQRRDNRHNSPRDRAPRQQQSGGYNSGPRR